MKTRNISTVFLLAMSLGVAGCAGTPSGSPSTPTSSTTDGDTVNAGLTWQEAKKSTQAMELEIANLIPRTVAISISQQKTGTLFSCDRAQHQWLGSTTVKVASGTNIETIIRSVESHYEGEKYQVSTGKDVDGKYRIQISKEEDSPENYVMGEGLNPDEVWISSASNCFTLPPGVYPGGKF